MRLIPLSTCEKEFIQKGFAANLRADGRSLDAYRKVNLYFGRDYGCCVAAFGNTKVLACVSCSLIVPKPSRPTSGVFVVNLELSPMASASYEGGRPESWIEYQRLLERTLRESGCVDVESLCVIGGEKVWQIKCDIHVLDNDGSILDCASFAAMAALRHFRRPFVTVKGLNYTIHTPEERSMVPLTVYNFPFCVSTGISKQENVFHVNDLTEREEMAVCDIVVIAMNSYREIMLIHTCKSILLDQSEVLWACINGSQLFRCQGRVATRVCYLTDLLNEELKKDAELRTAKVPVSFGQLIRSDVVYSQTEDKFFESTFIRISSEASEPPPVKSRLPAKKQAQEVTRVENAVAAPSDAEIIGELMQDVPDEPLPAAQKREKKAKMRKRQVIPEDVSMMLDEIEEGVGILDDKSLM